MNDAAEIMEAAINSERDKIRVTSLRGVAIENCKGLLLARAAIAALKTKGYEIKRRDDEQSCK